jgi:hypothetical protein
MANGSPDVLSGARPRITAERYKVELFVISLEILVLPENLKRHGASGSHASSSWEYGRIFPFLSTVSYSD